MKITKLKIKNLFGIREFESDGSNKEITGNNGTGKTSVIDAIRYALKNQSERDFIIRNGEDQGEVIIETDAGIAIHRKIRTGKADYKSIKQNKDDIQSPEAFLRSIFSELQLNPVEFLNMDKNEQNRIILNMIEFPWDLNWIKEQFGEIPQGVNYDQNILCVLNEIQAEDGFYFQSRQDINRDIRNNKAIIEDIAVSLPPSYDANQWRNVNLAEKYRKIEEIRHTNSRIEKAKSIIANRDNKLRAFQAEKEIAISAIEKQISAERERLEKENIRLENQIRANRERLATLESEKNQKIEIQEKTYKANVASFDAQVKEYEDVASMKTVDNLDELLKEVENVEKMKGHINEYDRMVNLQHDVAKLTADSEALTVKIEKARTLPGIILETAKIPVKNLTVENGIPLINGLPISNLSEGEKLDLCIDIATNNKNSLNILLIDGIETLSDTNRDKLYLKLVEKGVQFIATRTTEEKDLTVVTL